MKLYISSKFNSFYQYKFVSTNFFSPSTVSKCKDKVSGNPNKTNRKVQHLQNMVYN